jgi:hypothetical protein
VRPHVADGQPLPPVFAADEPDQLSGVERVAPGPVHKRDDDACVRRFRGQLLDQRGDIGRLEGADRHPLGARVAEQLSQRLTEGGGRLGVAHREQQEHAHPVQVAGQKLQQGQRGVVGGVQVIDDRQHGSAAGRLTERGGHRLVGPELAGAVLPDVRVSVVGDVTVETLAGRLDPWPVRQRAQHLAPRPEGGCRRGVQAPAPSAGEFGAVGNVRRRLREGGLPGAGLAD